MTEANTTVPAHGMRESLLALEALVDTLTDAAGSPEALGAVVSAARDGVGGDFAFWYSRGAKATALTGRAALSEDACAAFARKLLSAVPVEMESFRWANPDPPAPLQPSAACVARAGRGGGALVASSPGRGASMSISAAFQTRWIPADIRSFMMS